MSAIADPIAPPHSGGAGSAWERRIRPAVDAIRDPSPRALLVGNARSGKSTALRHLRGLLDQAPRQSVLLQGTSRRSRRCRPIMCCWSMTCTCSMIGR